jgi:hypothetical protein
VVVLRSSYLSFTKREGVLWYLSDHWMVKKYIKIATACPLILIEFVSMGQPPLAHLAQ